MGSAALGLSRGQFRLTPGCLSGLGCLSGFLRLRGGFELRKAAGIGLALGDLGQTLGFDGLASLLGRLGLRQPLRFRLVLEPGLIGSFSGEFGGTLVSDALFFSHGFLAGFEVLAAMPPGGAKALAASWAPCVLSSSILRWADEPGRPSASSASACGCLGLLPPRRLSCLRCLA